MKRIIAILLLPAFLLSATVGVAMTSLYCKGKITKTGIGVKACCENVNKGGCCKTKSELVKVKDSFVKSNISFKLAKFFNVVSTAKFQYYHAPIACAKFTKSYWDKAPPKLKQPLFLMFRSLLI